MFLEVVRELAKSPEPAGVGEVQAEAVRFGAGLALLGPYLGDGGVTIGSVLEQMRAAGEHAKAEAVVALLPALVVDGEE